MEDLISRKALLKRMNAVKLDGTGIYGSGVMMGIEHAKELVVDEPSVGNCVPAVPGHEDQYNIAEMAYNNGYEKGLEEGRGKWIPASEPPKEWRDAEGNAINYLAYIPETGVDIANWIGPANCWMCFGIPCIVTHWMPMPVPPKEVG